MKKSKVAITITRVKVGNNDSLQSVKYICYGPLRAERWNCEANRLNYLKF